MPVEVHRLLRIRQDWENPDLVAVLHLERGQRFADLIGSICIRQIETQHCVVLVRLYALDLDVAERP